MCHIARFVDGGFESDFTVTVGVEFKIKRVRCKGRDVKIQIWHTASLERFSRSGTMYRGASIVLVAYDITDRRSFDSCGRWFGEVLRFAPDRVLVGLVGCKLDLEADRVVSTEEGAALAASWERPLRARISECGIGAAPRVCFTETSSKTGQNAERCVARLLRRWVTDKQEAELFGGGDVKGVVHSRGGATTPTKCRVC
eukprot:TRINITY_DN18663_c0_g1_i1.p3 TRINITY_DN18663_c0_g1~~TRINITY_DN18663_c0_g1_i1.p3  ORF type:complete len:199 (-),score=41.71 TRINITY_DN18663_c0_g1_i1:62-658(-)